MLNCPKKTQAASFSSQALPMREDVDSLRIFQRLLEKEISLQLPVKCKSKIRLMDKNPCKLIDYAKSSLIYYISI